MPAYAGNEDMFLDYTKQHARGHLACNMVRHDDHMRRVVEFDVAFYSGVSRMPHPQQVDDLADIYAALRNGDAQILSVNVNSHGETEFRIVAMERMLRRMPTFAFDPAGSSVTPVKFIQPADMPQFTFTEPTKPKPKKIVTEKKVRTAALVGYRDFTYLKKGNQNRPLLLSRNGVPWPRYAPLVASCNGDPFKEHDAPSVGCQCGIYAFNDPGHAELKTSSYMWGEIALWGKVLICPDGYRAEYAYPLNIFIKDVGTKTVRAFGEAIEKQYGVPVHLVKERSGKTASEVMAEMIDKLLKESLSAD